MAITATTAQGTQLRDDRSPELANLIVERRSEITESEGHAAVLRGRVEARARDLAQSDARVGDQWSREGESRGEAGLTALRGPGLTAWLDDALREPDWVMPEGADPDDLVVHAQDVHSVVNAFWAGGAEAIAIMEVRVIATSAVRCVGNTLLLDGRVYSPPFAVSAIGDPGRIQRALDTAEGVQLFRAAAAAFGLGYQTKVETDVMIPAYDGSIALRSAHVPG